MVHILTADSEQSSEKIPSCLTKHCTILCDCAYTILLKTCEKLCTGDILVEDLLNLSQKRMQIENLCSVVSIQKGLKKYHPMECLACRLNEYQNFIERQGLLSFLCSQVSIPVVGMYFRSLSVLNRSTS